MSAVDPDTNSSQSLRRDSNLIALLFEAGQQKEVASDVVVDILQESLDSGRSIEDVVEDHDVLSRRQRETIRRFLSNAPDTAGPNAATKRDNVSSFSASAPSTTDRSRFEDECDEALPTGAERYSGVKEIGRGGWGVVLEARDGQLERNVAVKKLGPAAVADSEVAKRFLHEARITGQLEHPGVVPVYERGIDVDDRQPFYVMKLLNGVTLRDTIRDYHETTNAKEKREKFHQLLIRFNDVCQAVGYAHQKKIIHRDLKPSNVVIGEFGETIVVDWGLAKDLNAAPSPLDTEETVRAGTPMPSKVGDSTGKLDGMLDPFVTQAGSVIGTPAYMSPEQARGENAGLNQQADTYALGVMLYVTLTGKPPFHAGDVQTTLRKVMSGEYQHPKIHDKSIPTALAAICTKAMSLNPGDRYPTARELSDDVTCYLANEPVSAHKDSTFDKLTRWFRRNSSVAVSIVISTLLVSVVSAIAVIMISNAHKAEQLAKEAAVTAREHETIARKEAEESHAAALVRLDQARSAADEWLIGLSGTLQRYPGMGTVRHDLIEQGTVHYQGLLETLEGDPELVVEAARCRIRLGDLALMSAAPVENAQAYFQEAQSQLERCDSAQPETQRELLNARLGIALCEIRESEFDSDQAEELSERIQAFKEQPDAPSRTLARARLVLGRGYQTANQNDDAIKAFSQALDVAQAVPDENTLKHLQLVTTIREDLSQCYTSAGLHDEAANVLHEQVEMTSRFLKEHSDRPDLLEGRAIARMQWAAEQRQLGQDWQAEQQYRNAVQDLSLSWKLMFGDYFYSENLAVAQANLGQLAINLNRLEDAETMLRSAVDQLTGLMQSDRADRATAGRLAACNVSLGEVLLLRDHSGAGEVIRRSLDIFDYLEQQSELTETEVLARWQATANLARWHRQQKDVKQAAEWFNKCVEKLRSSNTSQERSMLQLLAAVQAELAELSDDTSAASESLSDAISILDRLSEAEREDGRLRRNSATLQLLRTLLDSELSEHWSQASVIIERLGSSSTASPEVLQLSAISCLRNGDSKSAIKLIELAQASRRYPNAVDAAIRGLAFVTIGSVDVATQSLALAESGLSQCPGNYRTTRWVEKLAQTVKAAQPESAAFSQ